MSILKLKGSTSGYVELTAPATAGNNTITLPTTAGSVVVANASGNVNISGIVTATTFSGNVSGNITIGAGSTSAPSLAPSGDSNTGVFFPAADTIAFAEGGTESARFDSSGRLLIGTTSSVAVDVINSKTQIEHTDYDASLTVKRNSNGDGGPLQIFVKSRGTSNGSNTVVQNGDSLGQLRFFGTDGTDPAEGASITVQVDGTPGNNDMPGRLIFSTTADGASSPTERMRIASTGAIQAFTGIEGGNFRSGNTTSSSEPALDVFGGASSTVSGTRTFSVRANGNVVNQNNSYGSLSDIKLKENIVDASSQWNDIKGLRPVNYNFKPETNQQTHTQIGLIAQEVELVSPGLVTETPDRDEEGNDLGTVTKSVNYSVLYMKAVKALQEAQERIETLEAENATLKNDFTALAARVTALESA